MLFNREGLAELLQRFLKDTDGNNLHSTLVSEALDWRGAGEERLQKWSEKQANLIFDAIEWDQRKNAESEGGDND